MPAARPPIWPAVRVFLVAFVVYAYFMPRWADWNIDSRLDLVHAIVDHASFRIDPYHWNTWDKAQYRGHFYSDKAPGTAVLGAGVYGLFVLARHAPVAGAAIRSIEGSAAWKPAIALGKTATQAAPAPPGTHLGGCQRTGGKGNVQYIPWGNRLVPPARDWALSKYVVTVGVVGFLSSLFAAFFFWFLGFFVAGAGLRWLATGAMAFATDALPYSTNFYSHQLVAAFLFVAFALLYLYRAGRLGRGTAIAAGFLLGFSFFTEYTVAALIPLIGLYGLWSLRRSPGNLVSFCLAAAVPVVALFAYNYACFGNPLDTGYTHDFCWSSAQAAGFAGFTSPQPGPLWDLSFGSYRGLLYMSPFLLLALPGAVAMVRRGLAFEALLCLVSAVGFIVLLSAYWGWNGGKVEGPRYLVPIIPFLMFPVAFYLDRWGRQPVALLLFLAGLAWALFVVWAEFLGGALFPTSWLRDPVFQYSLPALRANHIPPNAGFFLGLSGWDSLVPLALLLVVLCPWSSFAGGQEARTRWTGTLPSTGSTSG